jgi:hypothetical protein
LGSALAGLKAGVVASGYFAGSVSLFNIVLLFAFRQQVVDYLTQNYSTACGGTGVVPAGGAEACFDSIIVSGIPVVDFARTLVIALLFSVAVGLYFDYLPGPTYLRRGAFAAIVMLILMLFLGLYGIVITETQVVLMILFESGAVILYAVVLARLYRRFTREVEFQTVVATGKVIVDHRDLTGRKRTFSVNSRHKVEAAGELKSFKGWLVSGGVHVDEPKQEKTSITVTGDGLLKLA